jgi:SH3-like domain-containing protein
MRLALGLLAAVLAFATPIGDATIAAPVTSGDTTTAGGSGLSLPRYASLSADDVALRRGPGFDYPILWKYARRGLPVKIIREFGEWRRVSDMDGIEGWMHAKMLSNQRGAIIIGTTRVLFQDPDPTSRPVWRAQVGVTGRIVVCEEAWCQMNIDGKTGYVLRTHIWGTESSETIN